MHPRKFDMCIFMFIPFNVFIFFETPTHGLFRSILFALQMLGNFTIIFLILVSSVILLWTENILWMISILVNVLKFVLYQRYSLSQYMFCGHLKGRWYLILDRLFHICMLDPVVWLCSQVLTFCLVVQSIVEI